MDVLWLKIKKIVNVFKFYFRVFGWNKSSPVVPSWKLNCTLGTSFAHPTKNDKTEKWIIIIMNLENKIYEKDKRKKNENYKCSRKKKSNRNSHQQPDRRTRRCKLWRELAALSWQAST